jgi:hypothetical protein
MRLATNFPNPVIDRKQLNYCVQWWVVNCVEYSHHIRAKVESGSYRSSLKVTNLGNLRRDLALAWHMSTVHEQRDYADIVIEGKLNFNPHVVLCASSTQESQPAD